jgi:TolA-binding protein
MGPMQERINAMEEDQHALQGTIEELRHEVEELHHAFNRLKADVEQRYSDLETASRKPTAGKRKGPSDSASRAEEPDIGEEGGHPLEKARAQFNAGKHKEVEATIEAYLAKNPSAANQAVAHYWLGEALFAQNRHEEAALAFVSGYKADARGRRTAETLLKLARALFAAKKDKEARTTLRKLLQDYPDAPGDIREKAQGLLKQKA